MSPGGCRAALRAGGEPGPGAAGGHHPPAFPEHSPGPAKLLEGTRKLLTSTACSPSPASLISARPRAPGECVRSGHRHPHTGDNRQKGAGPKRYWPSERKQSHSTRPSFLGRRTQCWATSLFWLEAVRFGALCKGGAGHWGLSPSGDGCPPHPMLKLTHVC